MSVAVVVVVVVVLFKVFVLIVVVDSFFFFFFRRKWFSCLHIVLLINVFDKSRHFGPKKKVYSGAHFALTGLES